MINDYNSVTVMLVEAAIALTFKELGPFHLSIDSANIYGVRIVLGTEIGDKQTSLYRIGCPAVTGKSGAVTSSAGKERRESLGWSLKEGATQINPSFIV